jgi:hypothetical protein
MLIVALPTVMPDKFVLDPATMFQNPYFLWCCNCLNLGDQNLSFWGFRKQVVWYGDIGPQANFVQRL